MKTQMRAALMACGLAAAVACRDSGPTPPNLGVRVSSWVPDSAAVLAHQYVSGYTTAALDVVSDPDTWASVWDRVHQNLAPQPPRPGVDFGEDAVVLAAMGQRSTGGFDIRVDSVITFDGGAKVFVTETSPGARCFTPQMVTQPVHVVRVPRAAGPVVFETQRVVTECS